MFQGRMVQRGKPSFGSVLMCLGIAGMISGCALVPKAPSSIYDLSAPGDPATRYGTRAQLLVPEPTAIQQLDTNRIAVRPNDVQYGFLPKAVWSDQLPKLLQARLVETFQNTGRVRAVGIPGQGLLIDYQVIMDIRSYEIAGETAHVTFLVTVMNDRNGRVVSTRLVEKHAALPTSDTAGAVAALNSATQEAFVDITNWTLKLI